MITTKTLADLAGYTEAWWRNQVTGLSYKQLPTKGRPRRVYEVDDVIARLNSATVDYSDLIAKLRALLPEA